MSDALVLYNIQPPAAVITFFQIVHHQPFIAIGGIDHDLILVWVPSDTNNHPQRFIRHHPNDLLGFFRRQTGGRRHVRRAPTEPPGLG